MRLGYTDKTPRPHTPCAHRSGPRPGRAPPLQRRAGETSKGNSRPHGLGTHHSGQRASGSRTVVRAPAASRFPGRPGSPGPAQRQAWCLPESLFFSARTDVAELPPPLSPPKQGRELAALLSHPDPRAPSRRADGDTPRTAEPQSRAWCS